MSYKKCIARRRKHEIPAWMSYEANKPWGQSDADTAEGIDFMEYYARHMIRLGPRQRNQWPSW